MPRADVLAGSAPNGTRFGGSDDTRFRGQVDGRIPRLFFSPGDLDEFLGTMSDSQARQWKRFSRRIKVDGWSIDLFVLVPKEGLEIPPFLEAIRPTEGS